MPGNAGAITEPDAVMPANVLEDACQCLDASRAADDATMQTDGHHARLALRALAVQPVERVSAVDEEILAGAKSPPRCKRLSLASKVCGITRCGRPPTRVQYGKSSL